MKTFIREYIKKFFLTLGLIHLLVNVLGWFGYPPQSSLFGTFGGQLFFCAFLALSNTIFHGKKSASDVDPTAMKDDFHSK